MKDYLTGLQHIGVPTKDYEASISFYEKIGFEKVYETLQPNGGRVAFLNLFSLQMEIYEADEIAGINGAIDHIAIDCTDIERQYKYITGLGMEITSDGIESLDYWENGIRFFHISGPSNERVEFCQIL